ncbi:AAA family ATPase [Mycolicibacterium palauense]|uniref:AAA family ATPase n=1 Tax=Mycolicibacterium palauense TaxID=2034511 RepID=UPI000BFEE4C3|nr:MoxR family ATPase [Mycolicibacterium palauense]
MPSDPATNSYAAFHERVSRTVVGRGHEAALVYAAFRAGGDVMLEGPPGTGKSTLVRAVAEFDDTPFAMVEGTSELTPAKLLGYHDPARVMRDGYVTSAFVPGPLVAAMEDGGVLYIEELNRAPEDTLNVLLTAMTDRRVHIPRVGVFCAKPSFRIVASMNPLDDVGTARISDSVYDRWCRIFLNYQKEDDERRIVQIATGSADPSLIEDAVALTRATRAHPDIRRGSSVRGAIAIVGIAGELAGIWDDVEYRDLMFDAMLVALSARVSLIELSERSVEDVLREIWENRFFLTETRVPPA